MAERFSPIGYDDPPENWTPRWRTNLTPDEIRQDFLERCKAHPALKNMTPEQIELAIDNPKKYQGLPETQQGEEATAYPIGDIKIGEQTFQKIFYENVWGNIIVRLFMPPEERTDFLRKLCDHPELATVPRGNIEKAIDYPFFVTGLPDVAGETPVFPFEPVGAGGIGQVRKIFYINQEGKIIIKIIKSPLHPGLRKRTAERDEFFAFPEEDRYALIRNEAICLQAVQSLGENRNIADASYALVDDDGGRPHLVLNIVGDQDAISWAKEANNPNLLADMVFQAMESVKFLMEKGYIDVDTKIENFRYDSSSRSFKKIDFGSLIPLKRKSELQKKVGEIHDRSIEQRTIGHNAKSFASDAGENMLRRLYSGESHFEFSQLAIFYIITRLLELKFWGIFGRINEFSKTIPPPTHQQIPSSMAQRMLKNAQWNGISIFDELAELAQKIPEPNEGGADTEKIPETNEDEAEIPEQGKKEILDLINRFRESPFGAMVALAQQVTTAKSVAELQVAYNSLEVIKEITSDREQVADALSSS